MALFAEERGAASLEKAAALEEDFAEHWMDGHACDGMSLLARRGLAEEARNAVNELLHLQLPDYAGGGRQVRSNPFRDEAPGRCRGKLAGTGSRSYEPVP